MGSLSLKFGGLHLVGVRDRLGETMGDADDDLQVFVDAICLQNFMYI